MAEMTKNRKRLQWFLVLFFALLALLILFCGYQFREAPIAAAVVTAVGLVCVGLVSFGTISLIRGARRKALRIVCIAVGGTILGPLLIVLMLSGALVKAEIRYYDYREQLDQVSSVELVEVTKTGSYEDEFEYRLIKTIPPEAWQDVIGRIAELQFARPFNDPPTWWKGGIGFLIRFSPSVDGVTFVLIEQSVPVYGERSGSRVMIRYACEKCRSGDAWKALLRDYGE